MLPRPNGLKFFVYTHGWPEGVKGKTNSNLKKKLFKIFFLHFFKL